MSQKSDAVNCLGCWKAILLGLFVCWQLFYLPAANLIHFVPLRVPAEPGDTPLNLQSVGRFTANNPLQSLADTVGAGLARYSELSGQIQFWRLFSPEFPPRTIVLVTRARMPDGREVEIASPYSPSDSLVSIRFPRLDVRPFQFEASAGLGPWAVTPSRVAQEPEAARQLTVEWAGTRSKAVRVIMQSHWTRYKSEHPTDLDPISLLLVTRFIAEPGQGDTTSFTRNITDQPFVKWTNPFGPDERLEVFDPVAEKFVPVPEGPW